MNANNPRSIHGPNLCLRQRVLLDVGVEVCAAFARPLAKEIATRAGPLCKLNKCGA